MIGRIKIDRSRREIFRKLDDCESNCEEIIHFDSSGEESSDDRKNFEDSVGECDRDSSGDCDDDVYGNEDFEDSFSDCDGVFDDKCDKDKPYSEDYKETVDDKG